MVCSFKGCGRKVFSGGLCTSHYKQKRLGQELRPLQVQFHGLSEKERFEKWWALQPNGCHLWLGSYHKMKNRKQQDWHGQFYTGPGEMELAHRAAWRIYRGEILPGALVLHTCDNPRCVNPDHLYLGDQASNVRDMWDRSRGNPGISRGEKHGCAKLTEDQVREIRKSDERGSDIAKRLGVSSTTIYDIRKRRIWAHVE